MALWNNLKKDLKQETHAGHDPKQAAPLLKAGSLEVHDMCSDLETFPIDPFGRESLEAEQWINNDEPVPVELNESTTSWVDFSSADDELGGDSEWSAPRPSAAAVAAAASKPQAPPAPRPPRPAPPHQPTADDDAKMPPKTRPPPPRERGRKLIHFAPKVRVSLTIGRWELTEAEHRASWLSSEDLEVTQQGIIETVRAMRQCDRLGEDMHAKFPGLYSERGVEHMRTTELVKARKESKRAVLVAVLEEQDWQQSEEVRNDAAIAEASMSVSCDCAAKAALKGESDAAFVHRMKRLQNRRGSQSVGGNAEEATTSDETSSREPPSQEVQGAEAAAGDGGAAKADVDSRFTGISSKALRDRLKSRVAGSRVMNEPVAASTSRSPFQF